MTSSDYELAALEHAEAAGKSSEVERLAWLLLSADPASDTARTAWKRARRALNKDTWADLPERDKQAAYLIHCTAFEEHFYERLAQLHRATAPNSPGAYMRLVLQSATEARQAADATVTQMYALTPFQVSLIRHEGDTKSWPGRRAPLSDRPLGHRMSYRHNADCPYCGRCNIPLPYWPEGGDGTGFYAQTEESTRQTPGVYRLPLICLHCGKRSYIVWDTNPGDPVGGHFLRHMERLAEGSPENRNVLFSLIADEHLGRVVAIIEGMLHDAAAQDWDTPILRTEHFYVNDTFHMVSHLQAADRESAFKAFPSGYLSFSSQYIRRCAPPAVPTRVRVVHWVLHLSSAAGTSFAHLTLIPADSEANVTMILPRTLLTDQEWTELTGE